MKYVPRIFGFQLASTQQTAAVQAWEERMLLAAVEALPVDNDENI